jgi:hypothetical protein
MAGVSHNAERRGKYGTADAGEERLPLDFGGGAGVKGRGLYKIDLVDVVMGFWVDFSFLVFSFTGGIRILTFRSGR